MSLVMIVGLSTFMWYEPFCRNHRLAGVRVVMRALMADLFLLEPNSLEDRMPQISAASATGR